MHKIAQPNWLSSVYEFNGQEARTDERQPPPNYLEGLKFLVAADCGSCVVLFYQYTIVQVAFSTRYYCVGAILLDGAHLNYIH